jgi:hypothetical protein
MAPKLRMSKEWNLQLNTLRDMLENVDTAMSYILRIEFLVMGRAMRGMRIVIRSPAISFPILVYGGVIGSLTRTREIMGFALAGLVVF